MKCLRITMGMNLKTLNRTNAVHVLNMVSMVLAWAVTCYFFDSFVPNHAIEVIGDLLMFPVYFADLLLYSISGYSIAGNFNAMFLILWFSYSIPLTSCYPLLMVQNHEVSELREWYVSRSSHVS